MSTMVPLYGFGGGSGGTGAALTVNAPAGATVTVSKDGKSKTKVAGADGVAVFKGLSTGDWTLSITGGEQTAQKTVTITADYTTAITFFAATIHVTYPAGSTCTATDGTTTLTAPDTSGTWDCVVPNAGTWTVTSTDGTKNKEKTVSITADGQSASVELNYCVYVVENGVITDIGLSNMLISGRNATVQQNEDSVYIYNPDGGAVYGVMSGQKIDLTSYTKVVADVDIVNAGSSDNYHKFNGTGFVLTQSVAYSGVSNASNGISHQTLTTNNGVMTLTIDATSITGEWYVGFTGGARTKLYVYDLYAE